jgi:hypothetical protein
VQTYRRSSTFAIQKKNEDEQEDCQQQLVGESGAVYVTSDVRNIKNIAG